MALFLIQGSRPRPERRNGAMGLGIIIDSNSVLLHNPGDSGSKTFEKNRIYCCLRLIFTRSSSKRESRQNMFLAEDAVSSSLFNLRELRRLSLATVARS